MDLGVPSSTWICPVDCITFFPNWRILNCELSAWYDLILAELLI